MDGGRAGVRARERGREGEREGEGEGETERCPGVRRDSEILNRRVIGRSCLSATTQAPTQPNTTQPTRTPKAHQVL
jgi:hypothetical protein